MSALVGVIMGSKSDWPTMKNATEILEELGVSYEVKVCLLYTSPSPRDRTRSRMPSSA